MSCKAYTEPNSARLYAFVQTLSHLEIGSFVVLLFPVSRIQLRLYWLARSLSKYEAFKLRSTSNFSKLGLIFSETKGRYKVRVFLRFISSQTIIWYPLFGQLYVLANHLRIDRSNPTAAIESMKQAARAVVENNLSLIIFPEGTRSKNGWLLPFKKGFVHLALQSGLPIVPMVLTGTHLAWKKGSLNVRPAPLTVRYLPLISTNDWTADKIDVYIKMIHDLYIKHLPESQRPLVVEDPRNGSNS